MKYGSCKIIRKKITENEFPINYITIDVLHSGKYNITANLPIAKLIGVLFI